MKTIDLKSCFKK